MRSSAISLLLSVLLFGCATGSPSLQDQQLDDDLEDYITDIYCFSSEVEPGVATGRGTKLLQVPEVEEQSDALAFLSPASRQIAEVIQVRHLVSQIPIFEKEISRDVSGARIRLLELQQALSDQVLAALFDTMSVAAELECEKGRAESLASGMEEKQNDIQQRRTVIALLADATAGLLSGIFLFGGAEALAGGADIIGNLLQGTFGWAALGGQQRYELRLTRNHLKEVWEGPESPTLFPASVWRFLNSPLPEGRFLSRRELLVQEWKIRLGGTRSAKELVRKELLFGEGGTFSGTQLRQRAEMLDRVKASVRLMGKDLNLLFKESLGHLHGIGQMAKAES